jgi:hypothetical protein
MSDPAPTLDAATRASLKGLSDIALPEPVSWLPQTWGWAVLAVALLLLVGWALLRWRRQYMADRYRREALAELSAIETQLGEDMPGAITAMAPLLKRTALAAWPRSAVATLSGAQWVAFLRQSGGPTGIPDNAAAILDDREYRQPTATTTDEAAGFARALRRWIDEHRVSA